MYCPDTMTTKTGKSLRNIALSFPSKSIIC